MHVSGTYQERLLIPEDVPGICTACLLDVRMIRLYRRMILLHFFRNGVELNGPKKNALQVWTCKASLLNPPV